MTQLISWFELPATDFERACNFYAAVLECAMEKTEMDGMKMGFMLFDGAPQAAVVQGEDYVPTANGPLVYFNAQNNLEGFVERVANAGGKVLLPKTKISDEFGYFALFVDTEGNRIAAHSNS